MKTLLTVVMVISSCMGIEGGFFFEKIPVVKIQPPTEEQFVETITEVLKQNNVSDYNIKLLIAQSKHESGRYKNNLTRYNNIFARHYSKRDTFAISAGAKAEGHSKFAIYPTLEAAVLSQVWYLRRKEYSFNWQSPYQFALELKKKGYYEASVKEYTQALAKHMEE